MDGGATETEVGENSVGAQPEEASRSGVKYEMADGTMIENRGQKRFRAESVEGVQNRIVAQVTDAGKGLLSVHRLVRAGHRFVFDKAGSCIEDVSSEGVVQLKEAGGMHKLKIWVEELTSLEVGLRPVRL